MEEQVEITQVQGSDLAYQQDKATIDIQINTAKSFPRNVKRAVDNSIVIVTMDTETASTCTYSLPRSGKTITGPSVHLAKILAQNWGNLRVEAKVVDIAPRQITCQAVAFDLENNLAIKVEVKRSIVDKHGKRFNDDMITVTGNAGNAIAMRNAILSVIPKAVVDKVYNEAKKTITGDISDKTKLMTKRKQVIDGFRDVYGVSEAEILKVINKASIDHIDSDNLITLIGIAQAIKDGDTTVEDAFRKKEATKTNVTADKPMENIEVKVSDKHKQKAASAVSQELPLTE